MKRLWLILSLLFLPLSVQAATYTLTWCPVVGALWYDTCIETTVSSADQCQGTYARQAYMTTSVDISIPDGVNAWVKVRAEDFAIDWVHYRTFSVFGPFSNPIQIIGGLTPPIVVCGCP